MLSVSRFTLNTRDEEAQLSFSVKQGDTARRIIATLTENGEMFCLPDDCYAVFAASKSDGTKFNDSCVIQDGRIIYDLDPQLTLAVGRADCDITVYSSGGAVISTARFTMTVFESIFAGASDDMVSKDTFHVLNNLIGDANDTINDMEELNDAVTAAEALRVEAENAREEAETARETAETARETAETARETAEDAREAAEKERDAAEDERIAAEDARKAAETARTKAESARAAAEDAREEAEAARVEAEQERVDVNTGIVAQASAAASTASTAASTASTAAQTAATAADVATAAASSASGDAEDAESAAVAAESWTQGGTGTREGEDTNNAYYWYTQAQSIAGGDYAPRIHTHVTDDITDFPDTMPPSKHTHSIDDITDYTPEEPPTLTEGTANGTVNYGGTDVPVHGLGSAAYTESTAYDSAGSAATVGANLSAHIADKANPHSVTAAQAGAAPSVHTHNASDITAGTLGMARLPVVPVNKGGTGANTSEQARANLGAASADHTHSADDITSGTLPISSGGTGATTAAQALINFGITATTTEINSLNGVSSNIQEQISSLQTEVSGGGILNNNTNGWKTKVLTSANFDNTKRASVTFEYKRFLLYGTDFANSNNNGYHVVLIDLNSEDLLLFWGYENDHPDCQMYTNHEISGGYNAPLCTGAEVYKGDLHSNQLIIKINSAGKTSGTLYYIQI